jgi:hypothetical protein
LAGYIASTDCRSDTWLTHLSFEEDLQRFSTHISRRRVVAKRGPRWPLRTRPIVSPQGDAIDEEIPTSVLDAMRELSDADLAKLIKVISDYN